MFMRVASIVIFSIMAENMELFKQFQDNPSFRKWLSDLVFNLTYNPGGKMYMMPGTAIIDRSSPGFFINDGPDSNTQ